MSACRACFEALGLINDILAFCRECGLIILAQLHKTLEGTELLLVLRTLVRRWPSKYSDTPDPHAPIIAALALAIRNTAVRYARVDDLPHHHVLLYAMMWRSCGPTLVRGSR